MKAKDVFMLATGVTIGFVAGSAVVLDKIFSSEDMRYAAKNVISGKVDKVLFGNKKRATYTTYWR